MTTEVITAIITAVVMLIGAIVANLIKAKTATHDISKDTDKTAVGLFRSGMQIADKNAAWLIERLQKTIEVNEHRCMEVTDRLEEEIEDLRNQLVELRAAHKRLRDKLESSDIIKNGGDIA